MNSFKRNNEKRKMRQISVFLSLTVVLAAALVVFSVPGFALMKGNDSPMGFGGGTNGGESAGIGALNTAVIESAGYSMESQSQILLFLAKIERSEVNGVDFKNLRQVLAKAIFSMEKAESNYVQLKQLADQTPYNEKVITQLTTFDYDGYKDAHSLNPSLFNKARTYLELGDVRGVYGKMLLDTRIILELLYRIDNSLENKRFPASDSLWRLNQYSYESLIFGQYVAEVFYALDRTKRK